MTNRTRTIMIALVLALAVGILIGAKVQQSPGSSGGWPVGSAAAAQLTPAMVSTTALLAIDDPTAAPPAFILARGQEIYDPSGTTMPSGTPDEAWIIMYHPVGTQLMITAYVPNEGDIEHGRRGNWDPTISTFWDNRQITRFVVDSAAAVNIAHGAGGMLASQQATSVVIDYQLMNTGAGPVWDIVYRDANSLEGLFAMTVDAMTAAPLTFGMSYAEQDIDAAIATANPSITFASDATLVSAMAVEAPPFAMRSGVESPIGWMPEPISTIEYNLGDALAASWYLEFYSDTLNETMMIVVLGHEVVGVTTTYKTQDEIVHIKEKLGKIGSRVRVLDLEDAYSNLVAGESSGSPVGITEGVWGRISTAEMRRVDFGDLDSDYRWLWTLQGISPDLINMVDATTGVVIT